MEILIVIGLVIGLALYGAVLVYRDSQNIAAKRKFAVEFMSQLAKYFGSHGGDMESYSWLINRSSKMQNQLGSQGIMGFKPPFQNYIIPNYPVILNAVPEMRKAFEDGLTHRLAGQYAGLLQETLVRHIGTVEDMSEEQQRWMKNPVIWLREGIRGIISFPILLLSWLGLISERTVSNIASSNLFKILSGFVTVVGFISAIITITLGWKQFRELIVKFIS